MIRKCLKFNASFIEILKNSSTSKVPSPTCPTETLQAFQNHRTYSSLVTNTGNFHIAAPVTSSTSINPIKFFIPHPCEKGDNPSQSEVEEEGSDVESSVSSLSERTPATTEVIEMRGPDDSAFLIEVNTEDRDEVRQQLDELRGDIFLYDKSVAEWFTIKCMMTVEPLVRREDQKRLVRIHAITTSSEDVQEVRGTDRFTFVNSIGRMLRVKRMLEKLEYKICEILYRFHPSHRAILSDDETLRFCNEFVAAVENLPKVISVTHNLRSDFNIT